MTLPQYKLESIRETVGDARHQHDRFCYGPPEPCGEHHACNDSCMTRTLRCSRGERVVEIYATTLFELCDELVRAREIIAEAARIDLQVCSHCGRYFIGDEYCCGAPTRIATIGDAVVHVSDRTKYPK